MVSIVNDKVRNMYQQHWTITRTSIRRRFITIPYIIVLFSNSLWDFISNQEVIELVKFGIQKFDPNQGNDWEEGGCLPRSY